MRWLRESAPLVLVFVFPAIFSTLVFGGDEAFVKPIVVLFPVIKFDYEFDYLTLEMYELTTDDVLEMFMDYISGGWEDSAVSEGGEVVMVGEEEKPKAIIKSPSLMVKPGRYFKLPEPEWITYRKPVIKLRVEMPAFMHFIGEYLRDLRVDDYQSLWSVNRGYEETFDLSQLDLAKRRYEHIRMVKGESGLDEGLVPNFELPAESEIKISGRKLVSIGYSRQKYPESYSYGEDDTSGNVEMEQELQVQVEGVVSRKTHINIDYDDTRENESRNKISVVYQGDEDEFVQEAAFGDIVLSVPSTEFLSYSSSRSVFGGKLDVKKGPFKFLTIASREKGKTQKDVFTGGKEFTVNRINDTNYAGRKYFTVNADGLYIGEGIDVEEHDKENNFNNYFFNNDRNIMINDSVDPPQPYLEVFTYTAGYDHGEGNYYSITAYRYDDSKSLQGGSEPEKKIESDFISSEYFKKLQPGVDYTLDVNSGIITFTSSRGQYEYLAVAYKIADDNGNYLYSIGYNGDDVDYGSLKLIKDDKAGGNLQYYEFHNRYFLGATDIDRRNFVLKLFDTNNSETNNEGERYMVLYGLDANNDLRLDEGVIDYDSGILIFPMIVPFDYDGNNKVEGPDAYEPDQEHEMYIYVEYEAIRNVYILRPNIIPGSEEVRVNGILLVRDQDYIIEYDSGYLEFLTDLIYEPDARIDITYEYSPFFAESSKVLAGVRGEIGLGEDSNVGVTYLGEWASKPRHGEIPSIDNAPTTQNILDTNLRLYYHPEFMTNMIDGLPLIETEYPSTLSIEAEVARSFLNPNVVGTANVDDMEGTKIAPGFPMRYEAWQPSSPPGNQLVYNEKNRVLLSQSEFNIEQSEINSDFTDDFTYVLVLGNLPKNPFEGEFPERWGGICRNISVHGMDYIEKEYKYLEMMVWFPNNMDGLFHVDLGEISEDADSDSILDTEDTGPGEKGDGRLQQSEDVGWEFDNSKAVPPFEPGNDYALIGAKNGFLDTEDFDFDGNLDTIQNYFEYTVDIGEVTAGYGNEKGPEYVTDYMNWYENGRWVSIRIPLELENESREENYGNPDPTAIKHIRIWVEAEDEGDFSTSDQIWLASLAVVGNRWEEAVVDPATGLNDALIEVISNKTDSEYIPLREEYDERGYLKQESSLALKYVVSEWNDVGYFGEDSYEDEIRDEDILMGVVNDSDGVADAERRRFPWGAGDGILNTEDRNHNGVLDEGEDVGWVHDGYPGNETGAGNGRLDSEDEIYAYTRYESSYLPYDFTGYRNMIVNFYPKKTQFRGDDEGELFFIRFGSDDNNFYEYFVNATDDSIRNPDASGEWRLIKIDLLELVDIQARHSSELADGEIVTEGNVKVKGDPSLYNILEITVGVRTTDPMLYSRVDDKYAEIWINDIALEAPIDESGYARRVKVDLGFADFITVGGEYKAIDSEFQSIGHISSSKTESDFKQAYSTLEISKFMPGEWKVSMPVSVKWSKNVTYTEDRYDPENSIYNLGKITSISRQYNLGFRRVWLPTCNLGYSHTESKNEKYERRTIRDTYSTSFGYEFPDRIAYLPTNISATFRRFIDKTLYYAEVRTDPDKIDHTDHFSSSMRFEPLRRFEFRPSYGYSLTRDRIEDRLDYFSENYGFSSSMSRVSGMRPSFSYTSSYSEDRDYTDNTMKVSNYSSLTSSFSIEPGRLGGGNIGAISSMSISPTYTLSRSSTYYDITSRPGFKYRFGYDPILHNMEPRTAMFKHTLSISTRFRPFEFMSYKYGDDENLRSWDCVSTTFSFKITNTKQLVTGSLTKSRSITFPSIQLRIDGVKNFPIFANMLERSSVVLGYDRQVLEYYGYSHSVDHSPSFSWRATWSENLKTIIDLDYTMEKSKDFDLGTSSVTTTVRPKITIDYNLRMPKGYTIPVLEKIFRMRNELDFIGTVTYTRIRNLKAMEDDTNRWDADVSAGYYITSNLRMTISVGYTKFKNLSEAGLDYSTTNVFFTAEALF